jgi:hypothetical protein
MWVLFAMYRMAGKTGPVFSLPCLAGAGVRDGQLIGSRPDYRLSCLLSLQSGCNHLPRSGRRSADCDRGSIESANASEPGRAYRPAVHRGSQLAHARRNSGGSRHIGSVRSRVVGVKMRTSAEIEAKTGNFSCQVCCMHETGRRMLHRSRARVGFDRVQRAAGGGVPESHRVFGGGGGGEQTRGTTPINSRDW